MELCLLNYARGVAGVGPLNISPALMSSARLKADDIVRCNQFAHDACGLDVRQRFADSGYFRSDVADALRREPRVGRRPGRKPARRAARLARLARAPREPLQAGVDGPGHRARLRPRASAASRTAASGSRTSATRARRACLGSAAVRVALMIEGQEGVTWEQWVALARRVSAPGSRRSSAPTTTSRSRSRTSAPRTTRGRRSRVSPRARPSSASARSSRRSPSVTRRCSRTPSRPSTTSRAVGSSWGWAPAGTSSSTRLSAFRFHRCASDSSTSPSSSRSCTGSGPRSTSTFEGKHYHLVDCPSLPKPVQDPHPPLLVGGRAKPGTATPAARFADEYNVIGSSLEDYAPHGRRSTKRASAKDVTRRRSACRS